MRRIKARAILQAPGWSPSARRQLEKLIRSGAGRGHPVVFDFDNTIMWGDIGEATLAVLARDKRITKKDIPEALGGSFRTSAGETIALSSCADLTEYYEALLAPTIHGLKDPTPLANGYVWAVQIMRGLSPLEILRTTAHVFALSRPGRECFLEVTPGQTAYAVPFFYPETVELIAALLSQRYDVWIVSASNVWSVRWMVLRGLNPMLSQLGVGQGIRLDHVLGVSTLLADKHGCLHKDSVLVREDAAYALLDEDVLGSFRLTAHLQFPVPTYSGKIGCVWDVLGRRPYLCVGDSPGDHALLAFSENRLWIARLEKPEYQQKTLELIGQTGPAGWIIQPALCRETPGFVADLNGIRRILPRPSAQVRASVDLLASRTSSLVSSL